MKFDPEFDSEVVLMQKDGCNIRDSTHGFISSYFANQILNIEMPAHFNINDISLSASDKLKNPDPEGPSLISTWKCGGLTADVKRNNGMLEKWNIGYVKKDIGLNLVSGLGKLFRKNPILMKPSFQYSSTPRHFSTV